jgi:PAS domain-containing protein
MPSLIDTLFAAVKRVTDKRLADQFRQREISDKVQKAGQNMLAEITNISPNPTIVYTNGSIIFMNRAFQELFAEEDIKNLVENEQYLWTFLNEKISIDSILHADRDFIEQLDDFKSKGNKHKISLRTKHGRKIFFVFRNALNLDAQEQSVVYTFNDITTLEYQKVQINQYNEYMNELMYTKYKSNESDGQPDIIDKTNF